MIVGSNVEGDWKDIRTNATKFIVCLYFIDIESTGRVKSLDSPKLRKKRLLRPICELRRRSKVDFV